MANRSTGGTGNADVAIKIILKKYHINILFKKINLSILTKLKKHKNKIKNIKTHKFKSCWRTWINKNLNPYYKNTIPDHKNEDHST